MFSALSNTLIGLAISAINLFPQSPLQTVKDAVSSSVISPYLPWVNFFVPVAQILSVLAVWLSAVAIYYVYQIVLRWVKAIQ